jgi:hypothetical protein
MQAKIAAQDWGNIAVQDTFAEGKGVFATENIPHGQVVCNYGGKFVNGQEEEGDFLFEINYTLDGIQHRRFLDLRGSDEKTMGQTINHSAKHPNVAPKVFFSSCVPEVMFVSLEEIKEGTQLVWNYGRNFQGVKQCVTGCQKCVTKSQKASGSL